MKNNTLIFNTMKTEVKSSPKDWASYAFIVMFILIISYVAISANN